jgi:hypothetical protein
LAALILAVLGAIGWTIGGVYYLVTGIQAFAEQSNPGLLLLSVYAFISARVSIWVGSRTKRIRRALRYRSTLEAAALCSVSLGVLAVVFGALLPGILVLVARMEIRSALRAEEPSLGETDIPSTLMPGIEGTARDLGRLSLLLLSLGIILVVSSSYLVTAQSVLAQTFPLPEQMAAGLVVSLVAGALLLILAVAAMTAADRISRRRSPAKSAFLGVTSLAVLLFLVGGAHFFLRSDLAGFELPVVSAYVSAILLITGAAFYLAGNPTLKISGAILGIVAGGFLMGGRVGTLFPQQVGTFFPRFLVTDTFVLASYILAGIGALLSPLLGRTRGGRVPDIVAALAFVLFGIGTANANSTAFGVLSALGGRGVVSDVLVVPWLVAVFGFLLLLVSGILIVLASGMAIGLRSKEMLVEFRPVVAVPLQPGSAAIPAGSWRCTNCQALNHPAMSQCGRCRLERVLVSETSEGGPPEPPEVSETARAREEGGVTQGRGEAVESVKEEILGVIDQAAIGSKFWTLFVTTHRIIATVSGEIGGSAVGFYLSKRKAQRRGEELEALSPEELLNSHWNNHDIPYSRVVRAVFKTKPFLPDKLTIQTDRRKFKYYLQNKSLQGEYLGLLQNVLENKLEVV